MKIAWVLILFGVTTALAQESLKINEPVDHQLGSGAVQTYTLELKAGNFVDGLLERGI
jgi:hypothetical protein